MSCSDIYDLSIQAINEEKADRMPEVMRELRAAREVVEAARTVLLFVSTNGLATGRKLRDALAAYDAARNSTADPGDAGATGPAPTVEGTGSASFNNEEE